MQWDPPSHRKKWGHYERRDIERLAKLVIDLLRAGFPDSRIQETVGVSRSLWSSLEKEYHEGVYRAQPWGAVLQAKTEREAKYLSAVDAACDPTDPKLFDWKAARWRLTVTDPKTYAETKRIEHNVSQLSDGDVYLQIAEHAVSIPEEDPAWRLIEDEVDRRRSLRRDPLLLPPGDES